MKAIICGIFLVFSIAISAQNISATIKFCDAEVTTDYYRINCYSDATITENSMMKYVENGFSIDMYFYSDTIPGVFQKNDVGTLIIDLGEVELTARVRVYEISGEGVATIKAEGVEPLMKLE
jgi:hypothetical protein